MTWLEFGSTAWHESKHAAALLARGHVPLEVRCDWPGEVELNGKRQRINGWVKPDLDRADEPGFLRTLAISVLAGMPEIPFVAPERNDWGDDADKVAVLIAGRWDGVEEFLKLRFEVIDLMKSRPFRRLAIAVYEPLHVVEVLDHDALREIYEQEKETHAGQGA